MKKILLIAILMVLATSIFAEVKTFGTNDIWIYDSNSTTYEEEILTMFFKLDFINSKWGDWDPNEEGLLSAGFVVSFNMNDPTYMALTWMYGSRNDLSLPNYILVYDKNEDIWIMGGRGTRGDVSSGQWVSNGTSMEFIDLQLDQSWLEWFTNPTGTYRFEILEFTYGYSLWFAIPGKLFLEIENEYKKYIN